MGEGGREGGSTQQEQPDVGPLCGCGYGDILLYLLRDMRVVVKVVKIDRCIGVCTYLLGDQS